jgi:TolB-like protein/DNA-binding winged helix-turn-helix (wHTH) protein/Flp pilus assembly protein TadD
VLNSRHAGFPLETTDDSPRALRFAAFEVDLRVGELRKRGLKIKLQDQPFQILAMLLDHPGDVVTREELHRRLWPDDTFVDFDHGLNNAINRLREALCDSADAPRFIETLPRRGYRLIAFVERLPKGSAPVEQRADESPALRPVEAGGNADHLVLTPPSPARRSRGRLVFSALAVSVLLVVFAGLNVGKWWPRVSKGSARARIESIAVLPLENLSNDPSQEYFTDGMTDALITDLAQIRALRVISRTSAMHYKGAHKTLPEIAKELNVDAVLEGVVVRAGDRVRIDAQLIKADNDRHLWAKSYDRNLSDILGLQSEVASEIASEIQIKLTPQEQSRLARTRTVNPEAYENYVQGRYYWDKRSTDGFNKSIEYYEKAIQIDPDYAAAYAGLADSYNLLGFSLAAALPEQEAISKAKAAATKALELDPDLAEAHAALGYADKSDWDARDAEKEFQKAIDLDPGYATAYHWFSLFLSMQGRNEEALEMIRHAQRLDPVSPNIDKALALCLSDLGRDNEAIEQLQRAIELDPSHFNTHLALGGVYLKMKKYPEAIAEDEKALGISGGAPAAEAGLARAYAFAGRTADAEKILEHLKLEGRTSPRPEPYLIAFVYASLGHKDAAFQWLERAVENRSDEVEEFRTEPAFESLRSDPRFVDLVRRVKSAQEPLSRH